jgi:hypothetical protein
MMTEHDPGEKARCEPERRSMVWPMARGSWPTSGARSPLAGSAARQSTARQSTNPSPRAVRRMEAAIHDRLWGAKIAATRHLGRLLRAGRREGWLRSITCPIVRRRPQSPQEKAFEVAGDESLPRA